MPTIDAKTKLIIGSEYSKILIENIEKSKLSIYVLMFDWRWYRDDFSSDVSRINSAFVGATRRGVKVKALTNYIEVIELLNTLGINARKWSKSKLMHSKAIIIDEKFILMGSHNLTSPAMNTNIETSLFLDSPEIAKNLIEYFDALWLS